MFRTVTDRIWGYGGLHRARCLTDTVRKQMIGGKEVDWKLELVQVPVADIDRAKAFYTERLGFAADADAIVSDGVRFVQLTPPGSACSIALTEGVHQMAPGSIDGLQLVVDDVEAARDQLRERGLSVGEVQDFPWGRFVFFNDPDGNAWSVQQIPRRP
jgi:catechol 2,3-dioxygenase-like lactoylglutathione lyase family enzyme